MQQGEIVNVKRLPSGRGFFLQNPSPLPGFGFAFGFSFFYLGLLVLLPLSALGARAFEGGVVEFWNVVSTSRVLASLKLSFSLALAAAFVDVVLGLLIAWALTRYRFPLRQVIDAVIDLPFALPTAVAGIALASLYGPDGWIGSLLAPLGIKVAFTWLGILVAMVFVGLPFTVRSIQPIIQDFDRETEESAIVMGANWQRTLLCVILPSLLPSLVTAFSLAFARALGEYGSIIFIAGNIPLKTEITPLVIVAKLEQFDYVGSAAIACAMLFLAFTILSILALTQKIFTRHLRT